MNPTAKLLYISLFLAGLAIVSSSNGRTKRYAQEPQNPGTNPIQNLFNGISNHFQRVIDRLGNRYSDPTSSSPLRNWISGIGQQRNGSMVLDELLRRMNATWNQGLSRLNTTLSSLNFQLLRDLLRLRNASDSNQRIRIDGLLQRILSDLNERLSSSNMNVPSEILQELRQFIRNGMERHRNATQELGRLLLRIHSLMDQGIIRALSGSVSGENGLSLGGSSTSGEGSLSASGSGESGSISGSVSSGSGVERTLANEPLPTNVQSWQNIMEAMPLTKNYTERNPEVINGKMINSNPNLDFFAGQNQRGVVEKTLANEPLPTNVQGWQYVIEAMPQKKTYTERNPQDLNGTLVNSSPNLGTMMTSISNDSSKQSIQKSPNGNVDKKKESGTIGTSLTDDRPKSNIEAFQRIPGGRGTGNYQHSHSKKGLLPLSSGGFQKGQKTSINMLVAPIQSSATSHNHATIEERGGGTIRKVHGDKDNHIRKQSDTDEDPINLLYQYQGQSDECKWNPRCTVSGIKEFSSEIEQFFKNRIQTASNMNSIKRFLGSTEWFLNKIPSEEGREYPGRVRTRFRRTITHGDNSGGSAPIRIKRSKPRTMVNIYYNNPYNHNDDSEQISSSSSSEEMSESKGSDEAIEKSYTTNDTSSSLESYAEDKSEEEDGSGYFEGRPAIESSSMTNDTSSSSERYAEDKSKEEEGSEYFESGSEKIKITLNKRTDSSKTNDSSASIEETYEEEERTGRKEGPGDVLYASNFETKAKAYGNKPLKEMTFRMNAPQHANHNNDPDSGEMEFKATQYGSSSSESRSEPNSFKRFRSHKSSPPKYGVSGSNIQIYLKGAKGSSSSSSQSEEERKRIPLRNYRTGKTGNRRHNIQRERIRTRYIDYLDYSDPSIEYYQYY